MKLLAVETATEACSSALLIDGEVIERYQVAAQGHSRLIIPMMDALLAEAGLRLGQLDALAFGRGPGSFTGVRIATGVVQGAAFAADLPVVPVSTLAALALGQPRGLGDEGVASALDARMGQVYWGLYRYCPDGLVQLHGIECVCSPDVVEVPACGRWRGAGSGWGSYGSVLRGRMVSLMAQEDAGALPRAGATARLAAFAFERGETVSADQALPLYLRDQVVNPSAG